MLRMIQITSAAHASSYFSEDLKGAAYYSQGQSSQAIWGGKLAQQLGLDGQVTTETFNRLCLGIHPNTSKTLTPRMNKSGRTIGYDINMHPPKSFSLMLELANDERLEHAFQSAVTETLARMEKEMQTRVRKNKQVDGDRDTGNWCYALFQHHTSRPVDGVVDPHLHCHAVIFNLTFDGQENRIKAGQFRRIKREMPYYQSCFHSTLSRKVQDLGYSIRITRKGWEIEGVSDSLIQQFSRRTGLIERKAQEQNLSATAKDKMGASTREAKLKGLSRNELRVGWRERISDSDYELLVQAQNIADGSPTQKNSFDRSQDLLIGKTSLEKSIAHHFERETIVSERQLQTTALRFGLGQIVPEDLPLMSNTPLIRRELNGQVWTTTAEALATEKRILHLVRTNLKTWKPLFSTFQVKAELNPSQHQALERMLLSPDGIQVLEGKAGTGKTTLLTAFRQALESKSIVYHAIAPTAEASREVLRKDGFVEADTVASFLLHTKTQASLRDGVLIVDEAGLVGSKTLLSLLESARTHNYRVVLCGDSAQHKAVERGGILDTLVRETSIQPATLYKIQRQKGAYKEAVMEISQGQVGKGFAMLDRLGCIQLIESSKDREQAVIDLALASRQKGNSVLIISPTHAEGNRITEQMRSALQESGILKGKTYELERLVNCSLTEAERKDGLSYQKGMIIELVQNTKGYVKGERYKVMEVSSSGQVLVCRQGQEDQPAEVLRLNQAQHFKVCEVVSFPLQIGDTIRIGQNGKSLNGMRLTTGSIRKVERFSPKGFLVLDNGAEVSSGYGHWNYGYVSTSHASQGKTTDHVILSQSMKENSYGSMEQFYVSVSRGRKQVSILTDDKAALLERVSESEHKLSATALLRESEYRKKKQIELTTNYGLNSDHQPLHENTQRLN